MPTRDSDHPPYPIQDLLAGRVQMMFNDFTTSLPHIKAKTMNALAVSDAASR